MQGLERRERLIVIAAEQRVILIADARCEERVGGNRPVDDDAVLRKLCDGRRHDALFLAAKLAAFAGVRVEPREREARRVDFHRWLQFELDRQLGTVADAAREAGLDIGLYEDLAIGTSPSSSCHWASWSRASPWSVRMVRGSSRPM